MRSPAKGVGVKASEVRILPVPPDMTKNCEHVFELRAQRDNFGPGKMGPGCKHLRCEKCGLTRSEYHKFGWWGQSKELIGTKTYHEEGI